MTPNRSRRAFRWRPPTSAAHAPEIVFHTASSGIPASCGIVSVTKTAPPPAARWRPSARSISSARACRTFAAHTGHADTEPHVTRPRKCAEPSGASATTGDGARRARPQRLTRCWSGGSMAHRWARRRWRACRRGSSSGSGRPPPRLIADLPRGAPGRAASGRRLAPATPCRAAVAPPSARSGRPR
jgi:hypothetical protein